MEQPLGAGPAGLAHRVLGDEPALLGETFDIHGGGLDLVFPHHENEIAQSECCHGKPMVNYWMHNGLMQASDEVGKVGGRAERPPGRTAGRRTRGPGVRENQPLERGWRVGRTGSEARWRNAPLLSAANTLPQHDRLRR